MKRLPSKRIWSSEFCSYPIFPIFKGFGRPIEKGNLENPSISIKGLYLKGLEAGESIVLFRSNYRKKE